MPPPSLDSLRQEAYRLYQAGDAAGAERLCRQILEVQPRFPEIVYLLGVIAADFGHRAQALEIFRHASQLDPINAVYVNAQGEMLQQLGKVTEAEGCFQQAIALRPTYERAHNNLGLLLHARGDTAGATACYEEAIRVNPNYPTAHNNLGAVRQAQQRVAEAQYHFERALALRPSYPEAHFNLGTIQQALGNPLAAALRYEQALKLRPGYGRAHLEIGRALMDLAQVSAAVESFERAACLLPTDVAAHVQLANALQLLGRLDEALPAYDAALRLQPDHAEAFVQRFRVKQQLCDWSNRPAELARIEADANSQLATDEVVAIHPWFTLMLPWLGQRQLEVARRHARAFVQQAARCRTTPFPPPPPPQGRLRIGYLSRDLYDHPVGHVTHRLFGLHDRSRFEVHVYSFGPDDGSPYRQRIEQEAEHFHDVFKLSVLETAERIAAAGIHILVDMMGYTGMARTTTLALRPAPVQVQWLGYAGTMGAPFIDYLLSDSVVTPAERECDFSERIVRLPHSFFMTDPDQPLHEPPSRHEAGLPETGLVFCAFNGAFKIEPTMFAVWMRILAAVPNSILWLNVGPSVAQANLRREAEICGIRSERLVFATHVKTKGEHLARLRHADLFLDTRYYNAHATACDALRAGVPVLTCPGETFASRVAASLVTAVGLPELIVPDLEAYAARAISLASHPKELQRLKTRLRDAGPQSPLFDARGFVRDLERAFVEMWHEYSRKGVPAP